MDVGLTMFYSALALTGVNLLLRLAGTAFQVYLSGRIGAAGIGLLQLVLSVAMLAETAGIAGVRTACMYLSAEELGRRRAGRIPRILLDCGIYALVCGSAAAGALYAAAPTLAEAWIGDVRTAGALRLFACFLPAECLCAVLRGYFTAAGRIGTLAAVGVGEQLCSIAATLAALTWWAGGDPARACQAVIFGGGMGVCFALAALGRLRPRRRGGESGPVARRLLRIAVPLALADDLKAGLSAGEKLIIPERLARHPGTAAPMASFGAVCGQALPVLMFPAAILFALAELLIPELARCAAVGSTRRIRYLVRRSLRMAALYGLWCGGLLFLWAGPLCETLYGSREAGKYLMLFAPLAPMLYCDALTDAMTKGLGEQQSCVRYNILTSALDLLLLAALLPRWGMGGYLISFLVTHALNFLLSIRLLLRTAEVAVSFWRAVLTLLAALAAVGAALWVSGPVLRGAVYLAVSGGLFHLTGALGREDLRWARGLVGRRRS